MSFFSAYEKRTLMPPRCALRFLKEDTWHTFTHGWMAKEHKSNVTRDQCKIEDVCNSSVFYVR